MLHATVPLANYDLWKSYMIGTLSYYRQSKIFFSMLACKYNLKTEKLQDYIQWPYFHALYKTTFDLSIIFHNFLSIAFP